MFGYRIGVFLYHTALRVAARFGNGKARAWIEGRRDLLPAGDRPHFLHTRREGQPLLWMHASSLGEFEQGRPVLELLRERLPGHFFLLTFFSPSGYEKSKDYPGADAVTYLPADTPGNAARWVSSLRPEIAIFVKYDFWLYHLRALRRAGAATFLIAGSFRPSQPFFRWYGRPWREALRGFRGLIVQTESDKKQLDNIKGLSDRVLVGGDPRTDRVLRLAATPFVDEKLESFTGDQPVLFAGSVWPADLEMLAAAWPLFPGRWKLVIAPHRLREEELVKWSKAWSAQRYSTGRSDGLSSARVLILDVIGILSRAYRYGRLAYVGGGFGEGIHNTLEPMAYGLPVIFGPRYHKFPEAVTAVQTGGGFSVRNEGETKAVVRRLVEGTEREKAAKAVKTYTRSVKGAAVRTTELILARSSR